MGVIPWDLHPSRHHFVAACAPRCTALVSPSFSYLWLFANAHKRERIRGQTGRLFLTKWGDIRYKVILDILFCISVRFAREFKKCGMKSVDFAHILEEFSLY